MSSLSKRGFILLLGLTLAVPALAQDGPLDPNVTGRNQELKEMFAGVGQKAVAHAVELRRGGSQAGYGVVISGGFVLTCNSILKDSSSFQVVASDGTQLEAVLVAQNRQNDVALLQLQGAGIAAITFGSDANLNIGSFVITVGTGPTPLAVGVVSAKDRKVETTQHERNFLMGLFSDGNEGNKRDYPSVIQHDGAVEPGQFGSPLVDREGRLVGINVATPYRGSTHAVGIDQIGLFLEDMKRGASDAPGSTSRRPAAQAPRSGGPWLGVSVVPAPPESMHGAFAFGLRVNQAEGPAAEAGLQAGDIIVEVDGESFEDTTSFANIVRAKKPGDTLKVSYIRNNKLADRPVVLGTAR